MAAEPGISGHIWMTVGVSWDLFTLEMLVQASVVVYTCPPSTLGSETGGWLRSWPACSCCLFTMMSSYP